MPRQEEELVVVQNQKSQAGFLAALIVFIWMMLGLLGFITSLVCFARGGSFEEKWVGLLSSVVLGPLYWIYFMYASPTYCKSNGKTTQIQKKMSSMLQKPFKKVQIAAKKASKK
jgi:hypothetical protein